MLERNKARCCQKTENMFVASFISIDYPEKRIQTKLLAVDEQAYVFGSCAFNKHSVLKIFMIDGLHFQTV